MREYLVCKIQYRDRDFIAAALYEDRKLVFLRMEPDGEPSLVGNVYRGVVDSVSRNIGGAFVDIGDRSLCFLPLKRHSHVQAEAQPRAGFFRHTGSGGKGCIRKKGTRTDG